MLLGYAKHASASRSLYFLPSSWNAFPPRSWMWLTPSFSWGQMSSSEWDLAWLPYIKHHPNFPVFSMLLFLLCFSSQNLLCCAVLCWAAQSCQTLCNPMDCSLPDSSVHGNSPGKNTGMGCHHLLQGIFLTQGLNPGLLHCKRTLPSKPPGKPLHSTHRT